MNRHPFSWRPGRFGNGEDSEPLRITGLSDALQAALGISNRFRYGHASVALDSDGTVVDLTCFTGRHHTIESAMSWANLLWLEEPRFESLILISAGKKSVNVLAEEDVEFFRKAEKVCTSWDIRLIDWIKTDGEDLRTMAISCRSEDEWGGGQTTMSF